MDQMIEWHDGFPEKKGLYRCRHNGKDEILFHTLCPLNGKSRWMTPKGYDVVGVVKWTGEPLSAMDI